MSGAPWKWNTVGDENCYRPRPPQAARTSWSPIRLRLPEVVVEGRVASLRAGTMAGCNGCQTKVRGKKTTLGGHLDGRPRPVRSGQ